MGLCSSREQPRTRVGGYSFSWILYPKHRGTAPGFLCRRRCDTNNPALLPLVRAPLPQRESTTVDLNEAVVGEIAGQRQGATSRVVARHTGTASVTHATIDLVKPPGRLISPLSACTNASRLSATPRCPMLWCLADLCRCPVGLLGSACSSSIPRRWLVPLGPGRFDRMRRSPWRWCSSLRPCGRASRRSGRRGRRAGL
jgi:hypothetical protein